MPVFLSAGGSAVSVVLLGTLLVSLSLAGCILDRRQQRRRHRKHGTGPAGPGQPFDRGWRDYGLVALLLFLAGCITLGIFDLVLVIAITGFLLAVLLELVRLWGRFRGPKLFPRPAASDPLSGQARSTPSTRVPEGNVTLLAGLGRAVPAL